MPSKMSSKTYPYIWRSSFSNNIFKNNVTNLGLAPDVLQRVLDDPTEITSDGIKDVLTDSQREAIIDAFTKGYRTLFIISAALTAIAAVTSFFMIKQYDLPSKRGEKEKEKAKEDEKAQAQVEAKDESEKAQVDSQGKDVEKQEGKEGKEEVDSAPESRDGSWDGDEKGYPSRGKEVDLEAGIKTEEKGKAVEV